MLGTVIADIVVIACRKIPRVVIVVERTVDTRIRAEFSYVVLNDVMRIIKEEQPTIEEQIFDNLCTMRLSVRNSKAEIVLGRLRKVEGAIVEVIE